MDVVVTDGFTGNVFLKTVEAVHARECGAGTDVAGAAVRIGVRGEVLVAHGAAGPAQVHAALRTARRVCEAGLQRVEAQLPLA